MNCGELFFQQLYLNTPGFTPWHHSSEPRTSRGLISRPAKRSKEQGKILTSDLETKTLTPGSWDQDLHSWVSNQNLDTWVLRSRSWQLGLETKPWHLGIEIKTFTAGSRDQDQQLHKLMMKFLVFVSGWEFVILILLTRPVLALRPRISRYFMVSSALVRSLFSRLELSPQKRTAQVRTQCIRTTHSCLMYAFDWWNGVMCCNHFLDLTFHWLHVLFTVDKLCFEAVFWSLNQSWTGLCSAVTHAENVALPAYASLPHRTRAMQLWYPLSAGPQQQTCSNRMPRPNGTYGWTNARRFHRPCSAYSAGSSNK